MDYIYIMAHTSSEPHAGSDGVHEVEMVAKGQTRLVRLPDLPGDEYLVHKSDLWKLSLSSDFYFSGCISKGEIQSIAIEEHDNDAWIIDSIITILRADAGGSKYYEVATMDMDVNRWIDGDSHWTRRRFELSLLI